MSLFLFCELLCMNLIPYCLQCQYQQIKIMIKIKQNVVTLKGITLRSSLELYNPNQLVAVMFQIQCPQLDFELCIEPKKGIIMQNQVQKIKVWVRNQDRDKAFVANFTTKSLKIKTTYRSQYNRKIYQKYNMTGYEKAMASQFMAEVPIVVSHLASSIKSDIKNSMSSSLNKIGNSKQFFNNRKDQFQVGQSNSNQFPRPLPKVNEKKLSDKLTKQLQFLFDHQISGIAEAGRSNTPPKYIKQEFNFFNNNPNAKKPQNVTYVGTKQIKKPEVVSYAGQTNIFKTPETVNYLESHQLSPFSQKPNEINPYEFSPSNINRKSQIVTYLDQNQHNQSNRKPEVVTYLNHNESEQISKKASDQRFLQILMLAALAGFFAALGSNFKQLFN